MVSGTILGFLFGVVLLWALLILGAGCLIYLTIKLVTKVVRSLKDNVHDGDEYGVDIKFHKNN